MACEFTLEHYEEIISTAIRGGYEFKPFKDAGESRKTVFLRHDIDVSVSRALRMAEVDGGLGVRSTFFFMIDTPIYNIFEEGASEMVRRISDMGHWIGVHVDFPSGVTTAIGDPAESVRRQCDCFSAYLPFDSVISFHRPDSSVLGVGFEYPSTYEDRFFSRMKYLSDSSRSWREGCPCSAIAEDRYEALQLLVHPIWWVDGVEPRRLGTMLLEELDQAARKYLAENVKPFEFLREGLPDS